MHIVTGGAYNGKARWVKDYYQLNRQTDYCWFNAYEQKDVSLAEKNEHIVIIEGVHQLVRKWLQEKAPREFGRQVINEWLGWEAQHEENLLIIIGNDLSKGIVPADPVTRQWRDVTGWFYQDLVEKCNRFDVIWYGINKQFK